MSSNGTTPAELEADVERQRDALASTVNQLQAKLDVRARVRDRLDAWRERVTTPTGTPRVELLAGAGAFLSLLFLVVWRRRR